MSADPRVVYGADRVGTRFNVVDEEHPGGHHGQDFRLPAGGGSEVVAYTECTVVECGIEVTEGFTAILGWYVVARTPLGRYLGWAHLRRGTRAPLGKVLKPGDRVGLAASGPRPSNYQSPAVAAYDYPGTAWTAAHIHTTNGSTISSIFSGVGLIDPLPGIRTALVSLADTGTGYTPIAATTPTTATEITMTYEEFRDFLRRAFKFDVREGEVTGATIWERLSLIGASADKADPSNEKVGWPALKNALWRFLKYHAREDGPDGKAPTIFEQLNTIEAAVKANGAVTIALSDEDAAKIASRIAVNSGVTAADREAIVAGVLDGLARRIAS